MVGSWILSGLTTLSPYQFFDETLSIGDGTSTDFMPSYFVRDLQLLNLNLPFARQKKIFNY